MNKLIFLTNEFLNPDKLASMKLPMTFISFGLAKGRMYRHFRNQSTFIMLGGKTWGNKVVYGALFLCKDFRFYARLLDAYHVCSLTTMNRNHILDIHHRVDVLVTPIYFDSLDDMARLLYRESDTNIMAQTYVGNPNHPKIAKRFYKTNSHRLIDGVDVDQFKTLFGEVTH